MQNEIRHEGAISDVDPNSTHVGPQTSGDVVASAQNEGHHFSSRFFIKFSGFIGVVGVILGNVAAIVTHIDELRTLFVKYFGADFAFRLHGVVLWGSVAIFFTAYCFLSFWAYRSLLYKAGLFYRITYIVTSAILIVSLTYGAMKLFNPVDLVPIIARQNKTLISSVILQQMPSGLKAGGFRFAQNSESDDVQAWTSAQALVSILSQVPQEILISKEPIFDGLDFLRRTKMPHNGWDYMALSSAQLNTVGVTEVTAWATLAYVYSLRSNFRSKIWRDGDTRQTEAIDLINDNVSIIVNRQFINGGWSTIENTGNFHHIRTYSTVMALWALAEAYQSGYLSSPALPKVQQSIRNAARFLLETRKTNAKGLSGWWPNPETDAQPEWFPGLTAQALFVLVRSQPIVPGLGSSSKLQVALSDFLTTGMLGSDQSLPLINWRVSENQRVHDSDRYLEGRSETVEGSTFLWYPWSLALSLEIWRSKILPEADNKTAAIFAYELLRKSDEVVNFVRNDFVIYPTVETSFAFNAYLNSNLRVADIGPE